MKYAYIVAVPAAHTTLVHAALPNFAATPVPGCCSVGWDAGTLALRQLLRRILPTGVPFLVVPLHDDNC